MDTPPPKSFKELRLVCPRCRAPGEGDCPRVHALVDSSGAPARVGDLADTAVIGCSNSACGALYPVVEGIPVVFAKPESFDLPHNPPVDIFSAPASALQAIVAGADPDMNTAALLARLGQHIWAGFHDLLPPDSSEDWCTLLPHATDIVDWVGTLDKGPAGLRVSLGSSIGREAWEVSNGPTLLVDAHFPSLLVANRLLRDGRLDFLLQTDVHRWEIKRLEIPNPPAVDVALLCCNVLDPPFDAYQFSQVLALNLLDSISEPTSALIQSHAMLGPGGQLVVSSPFTWKLGVTPRAQWFECLAPHPAATAEQVMTQLVAQLAPPVRLLARKECRWMMRCMERELTHYKSVALCWQRVQAASGSGPPVP